jgi:lipoprotein-anchoring transpeptidase ErfK/SrfK
MRMKSPSIASRILIVLLATLLLLASASLAWGVVLDYQARGLVPKGVSVAGQDLGGMTEAQARAVFEDAVSTPLLQPVTVTGEGKMWTLDPKGIVDIDVDSMVSAAYSPKRAATLVARLNSQLAGQPLPADIQPAYSVDSTSIATWVAQAATQVNRKPVDATGRVVKYQFVVTTSTPGATVNQSEAIARISQTLSADSALSSVSREVTLPIVYTAPKVLESSFKKVIVVSIPERKIRLFEAGKKVKTYRCAPGQPAFPTPTGDFEVVTKLANSPWYNPGSAWAAGMPDSIPAGPNNPMGVRKIGINVSGIFMHGIPASEYSSIGTAASHGCMRMMPDDVMDLFNRVTIGTPVYIRD